MGVGGGGGEGGEQNATLAKQLLCISNQRKHFLQEDNKMHFKNQ